ncbi:hypothetical protein T310_4986 [Rasamsonia emersonii CBS 393.64]|uniref:Protein kinase domain-containing protein n=1 Tax=Rasamsonia emersonii (strain ATCC 16479 / CBS 393.64 / IMI 116815) TaxID=1408163 RepID=A0A0F4YRR8_RASE3|nr:hypothetical protein T310_4986 [Rasamsonia emersonii CBS 393.64]KKA20987.1 hypothetical protein T310_4986 [Rasamsonia emersonii CBS 393.64]
MSVIVPFVEAIVTNQCRHRRVLLRSLPPIRSLSFLRAQTRLRTKAPAEEIAPDVAFEEESYPSYNPQAALEVHPGDVLNGRFCQKLTRRRWRWQRDRYVVLKFQDCNYAPEDVEHELRILKHIASANPSHEGSNFVRTIVDSFDVPRPDDLKQSNILVPFEDESIIEEFANEILDIPIPMKKGKDRTVYQSFHLGKPRSWALWPKITDFGQAKRINESEMNILPIQPEAYRAPEVFLGTGYTYSADIWNLGALIWMLMEGKDLFCRSDIPSGTPRSHVRLAEMIALLGPPPPELVERAREAQKWKWTPRVRSWETGELCDNINDFFVGPFFDEDGRFLHNDLIPKNLKLEDTVTVLEGNEKQLFLDFAKKMLRWLPEERQSAAELLHDPWLRSNLPQK